MYFSVSIQLLYSFIFLLITGGTAVAQSIPVHSLLDEQLMIRTLLSDSVSSVSFMRPFSMSDYDQVFEEQHGGHGWWNSNMSSRSIGFSNGITLRVLPFTVMNTVNSRFPLSENSDGAWYGKGQNIRLFGGVSIQSRFLSASIHPQWSYHQNLDFLRPRFVLHDPENNVFGTEFFSEFIDYPYRFGEDSFSQFNGGYSSVRLHAGAIETGVATNPQWWGPASHYPLVMSNNAAGFQHFFLGTRRALKLPLGSQLRFRWIMGYPKESGYFNGIGQGERRFINGIHLAFTPGNQRNFTVGFTRFYHLYEMGGFSLDNVFVLFDPFRRSRLVSQQGEDEFRQARNQMASIYFQLRFPSARGEIYGEFFREDHSYDFRDLLMQPHHNSAYSFGLRKLSDGPFFEFFIFNLELTNLTNSQLQQVRPQVSFYGHTPIGQGHTHRGQLLGAAIGPGSNSQRISLDGYKDHYKVGFFIQRHVINDNFHHFIGSYRLSPYRQFGDYVHHRINLNTGIQLLYHSRFFTLFGGVTWTKAFNYGRFETALYPVSNLFELEFTDRTNVQFQIGITVTP